MPVNVKVAFLGFLMKISEQFKKVQILDFFLRTFFRRLSASISWSVRENGISK